jgi:hypothetical protein
MAGKQLRVLARGTASVPVHSAHARGQSRFIGRVNDFDLGTAYTITDETGMKSPGVMPARVCVPEPTVISQDDDPTEFTEQMLHLRYGDLWPFDEETARMSGVEFDPTYGGEYAEGPDGKLVNVAHRDALEALSAPAVTPAAPKPALVTPATVSTSESK